MRKIKTLFVRDLTHQPALITPELTAGLEDVLAGKLRPTLQWDGTSCMVRNGELFKRYEVKAGRAAPVDFEPAQDLDPNTGKQPGWVPVGDSQDDRWHREALTSAAVHHEAHNRLGFPLADGTYELLGPKVQRNPYALSEHKLVRHGTATLTDLPAELNFVTLNEYLERCPIEGIVWWDAGGPVAKLKRRDFGFRWPVPA